MGVTDGVESYDCSGQSLLYSPDLGVDLSINQIIALASHELSLTADLSYRSKQQTNFLFLEETNADSYTALNLDATLFTGDGRWAFSAFIRNATDERYLTNTNVSNRGLAYGIYSSPRTYGIRMSAEF